MLRNFFAREEGQGLTEYALVMLLIAIAVMVAVQTFGLKLDATYTWIVSKFPST